VVELRVVWWICGDLGWPREADLSMHLSMVKAGAGAHLSFIVGRRGMLSPVLASLVEDDDLRVLAAELPTITRCTDVRVEVLHGEGDSVDLLRNLAPKRCEAQNQRSIRPVS
jgi:hypothetical protein